MFEFIISSLSVSFLYLQLCNYLPLRLSLFIWSALASLTPYLPSPFPLRQALQTYPAMWVTFCSGDLALCLASSCLDRDHRAPCFCRVIQASETGCLPASPSSLFVSVCSSLFLILAFVSPTTGHRCMLWLRAPPSHGWSLLLFCGVTIWSLLFIVLVSSRPFSAL